MSNHVNHRRNRNLAILTGTSVTVYMATINQTSMLITVNVDGFVIHGFSPDKPCFKPNFLNKPWDLVKSDLEAHGALVQQAN